MQDCVETTTAETSGNCRKRVRRSSFGSRTSIDSLSSWLSDEGDHKSRSKPPRKIRRTSDGPSAVAVAAVAAATAAAIEPPPFGLFSPPPSTSPNAETQPSTTETIELRESCSQDEQIPEPDEHRHQSNSYDYQNIIKTADQKKINETDYNYKINKGNDINYVTPRSSEPKDNRTQGISKTNNESNEDGNRALYGDIVNGMIGIIVIHLYGIQLWKVERDDPMRATAISVWTGLIVPMFFIIPGVITKDLWLSRLGMTTVSLSLAYGQLSGWPRKECRITSMIQGQILIVLANMSLSFTEKMVRLACLFGVGSVVSIEHPHSVYTEDVLPILGGTVLLAIAVLYKCHFAPGCRLNIKVFRSVLLALFIYSALVDLKMSIVSWGDKSSFVRLACVACLGLIDTGIFQKELEVLVGDRTREIEDRTREIRSQHRMMGMALQASETAIAVTDQAAGGRIVWTNTALERMCQKSQHQLVGKPLEDVLRQRNRARHRAGSTLLDYSLDHSTSPNEEEILQIGDSVFCLEAKPFREYSYCIEEDNMNFQDSGYPNDRCLMVFKDITAIRARELAEKEARAKAMTVEAMEDAMVTLTHELRTPLQGIRGVTSVLLQQVGDLKLEMLESLTLIMASSGLLLNLINNLLDIKKVNANMMEEFPLSSIVASTSIEDAAGFCQPLASISNVTIDTDIRIAKQAIVMSNSLRLQQVLINLISNAIKYTKAGSAVCVRAHVSSLGDAERTAAKALARSRAPHSLRGSVPEDNDNGLDDRGGISSGTSSPVLVVSVSDCGPGISPDQAGRLFTRYAQLDAKPRRILGTAVGQPSGTGIGLNLCNLFVERMNGRIWAINNSHQRDGSTFSFHLPLVSIEAQDDQHDSVAESPNHSTVGEGGNVRRTSSRSSHLGLRDGSGDDGDARSIYDRRVLFVDDTLINRKVIHRLIREIGVTNLVTVESGDRALEELSANPYDLVITDLQMSGMSGTELSRAIHDRRYESSNFQSRGSVPVVICLTADTGVDVVEQCAASGMSDVLYKPLTLSEIRHYFETTVPRLKAGVWYARTC